MMVEDCFTISKVLACVFVSSRMREIFTHGKQTVVLIFIVRICLGDNDSIGLNHIDDFFRLRFSSITNYLDLENLRSSM